MTRTVIVGAGQAGRRTAEVLRDLDGSAGILLLGEEPHAPYDRPPLSKAVLLGEDPGKALFPRPAETYAERAIELRTGTRIVAIDPAARQVETAAGERLGYDTLVLATGAKARQLTIPGADDARVLTLRSLADAQAIRAALAARPRVAVIGGGLIGLEVAASARQFGCAVTVVEAGDRLMARCVPPIISDMMRRIHHDRGVAIELRRSLRRIRAEPDRLVLEADGASIEADLVVVGIGATPNTDLAEAAGLQVDNGIVTDASGRTSHPGIFAAGEVARFVHPFFGCATRLEAWQVAQNQPAVVARAICGQDSPYAEVPWHWTDQFDMNIQVLGSVDADLDAVIRPAQDASSLAVVLVNRTGHVRGAVLVNSGRDATPLRRLIGRGEPVDLVRLRDPAIQLRHLL